MALCAAPQTSVAAILTAMLTCIETFDTQCTQSCVLVSFLVAVVKTLMKAVL